MDRSQTSRRLAGGVGAVLLGMAAAISGSIPAQAGEFFFTRHQRTSGYNTNATKTATVTCPEGEQVYSTGGRINDGNGGVVLSAIVPDPTLTSVSVTGRARPGQTWSWSVTAFAACISPNEFGPPSREDSGAVLSSTTTATCDPNTRLTGMGFEVYNNLVFVDRVLPDAGLTQVSAHAKGGGIVVVVKTYAICVGHAFFTYLARGQSATNDTSPKPAETTDPVSPIDRQSMFVIGGEVVGGPGNVMLEALVPQTDFLTARATATVVSPLPLVGGPPPAAALSAVDTDDDWSTMVYGDYVDWY